ARPARARPDDRSAPRRGSHRRLAGPRRRDPPGPAPELRLHLGHEPGVSLLVLLLLALPASLLSRISGRTQRGGLRHRARSVRVLGLGGAGARRARHPGTCVPPPRKFLGRLGPAPAAGSGGFPRGTRPLLLSGGHLILTSSGRTRARVRPEKLQAERMI